MKDTFIQAKLVSPDTIRVVFMTEINCGAFRASLLKDGEEEPLSFKRISSLSVGSVAEFHLPSPLELGHSYFLKTPYGRIPLDVSEATSFPGFDEAFSYDGPLGASCTKKEAVFHLFAPLASHVVLSLGKKGQTPSLYPMKRLSQGVWELVLKGNYKLFEYTYLVTNSEALSESVDPYAIASTENGRKSVLIDPSDYPSYFADEALPVFSSPVDAVIYEGSVRDLTIDRHTDIKRKGKFLGLIEKGRKTPAGNPAGFDYFSSLGFTHLQFLPIYDFKTVDELHPEKGYNWGYDPAQYFVPEGSYSTDPTNPEARIKEVKALVKAYHSAGIRIVMDVVFNHVYDWSTSSFEKIVPNYYFRKRRNGEISNCSGCGDDFASERPMARRLILDACAHWIDFYGVDGFRIDLMGLLDVETVKGIVKLAKARKKDFLIYGEGWNMGGDTPGPLAHMGNYALLPEVGFFNDFYREAAKRYFAGDLGAKDDFKAAYLGSANEYGHNKPRFLDARQSINYVECHDGETYYDYLHFRRGIDSDRECRHRAKLAIAGVLLSFGVPFLHAGQEIGQSKFNEPNTFDKGDSYNKFSYRLLDERIGMARYVHDLIKIRRSLRFLKLYAPEAIGTAVDFEDLDGALLSHLYGLSALAPYEEAHIAFNPTPYPYTKSLSGTEEILLMEGEALPKGIVADSLLIPPRSSLLSARLHVDKDATKAD